MSNETPNPETHYGLIACLIAVPVFLVGIFWTFTWGDRGIEFIVIIPMQVLGCGVGIILGLENRDRDKRLGRIAAFFCGVALFMALFGPKITHHIREISYREKARRSYDEVALPNGQHAYIKNANP